MSIIHDALKKAQQNLEQNANGTNDTPADTNQTAYNLKKMMMPLIIIFTLLIFLSLTLLLMKYSSKPTVQETAPPPQKQPAVKTIEKVTSPINEVEKPGLVLSGIMQVNDKRVALINDDVYEEGSLVDDQIVDKITLTTVELMDKNGQRSVLNVRK